MAEPLAFIIGLNLLAAGLAIVLAHNHWSGNVVTVVVTLLGWIVLIKGLLLLVLPPANTITLFLEMFHYREYYYSYTVIPLLIGLYLTYAGFRKG